MNNEDRVPKPPPNTPFTTTDAELLSLWHQQTTEYVFLALDTDGRVIGASGGLRAILGCEPDEIIGEPLSKFFTPEDRALGLDSLEIKVARIAGAAEDDRWHVGRNDVRVWVTGTLTAVKDGSGRHVGFIKAMRNRTDLRAQIEALENRLASLTQDEERRRIFVGTLIHELRNPLAPLANALQLIRLTSADAALNYPLQVIDRQLAQLTRLVDDMMDVTRLDVGKLRLQLAVLEMQPAIFRIVRHYEDHAREKRLSIEPLLPEAPITIDADADRFEQILVNLLNNAVKFTPAGGRIWIKLTVEDPYAVLSVQDTGTGISPAMLPTIFQLFTQERVEGARAGLGIGLALVKQLVTLHGGFVEVRSEGRDRGSEFSVRLPLRQPQ